MQDSIDFSYPDEPAMEGGVPMKRKRGRPRKYPELYNGNSAPANNPLPPSLPFPILIESNIVNHEAEGNGTDTCSEAGIGNSRDHDRGRRQSYSREYKIMVIEWFQHNGQNQYKTCRYFGIDHKCLKRWLEQEEKLRSAKSGSKKIWMHGAKDFFPELENRVYEDYKTLMAQGVRVKDKWFLKRAKELLKEIRPSEADTFKFSDNWVSRFKTRYNICLRIHAQVSADNVSRLRNFHCFIRNIARQGPSKGKLGQYEIKDVGYVFQTPLVIDFSSGEVTADKTVRSVSDTSLSNSVKQTAIIQVVIWGDGICKTKPTIFFGRSDKHIPMEELSNYDKKVAIRFHPNELCNESEIKYWIRWLYRHDLEIPKLIIANVSNMYKMDHIQYILRNECNVTLALVPPGCFCVIQPLENILRNHFLKTLTVIANQYCQDNNTVDQPLPSRERRILISKWVGFAWKKMEDYLEEVVQLFEECGLTIAIDGSEDDKINIAGLPNYTVGDEHLMDDEESLDGTGLHNNSCETMYSMFSKELESQIRCKAEIVQGEFEISDITNKTYSGDEDSHMMGLMYDDVSEAD